MNVLIVDDSTADRSILKVMLQAHGCTVREAENGLVGLDVALAWQPDLIVSDALMPKMDGFRFLREAKADERLKEIPFIFYSSVYTGHYEEKLARSLGAVAFILKPCEPRELWREIDRLMNGGNSSEHDASAVPGEETFLKEYSNIVVMKLEEKVRELEELYLTLIKVLVNTLEAKSPWTRGHSERVADHAVRTAREAGLDEGRIARLKIAGLLHDIGKIGTCDSLLDKPEKLSVDEFAVVKLHPEKGVEIIADIRQFNDLVPVIRHHHERFDGSGYPSGLAGDGIPLFARILCIADAYDAMISERPYRPAQGRSFAVKELRRCAGEQFDPELVELFLGADAGKWTH